MSLSIPAWPSHDTPEGAAFFANAKAVVAAWKSKRVSNAFAFGMLAQAEAESTLDPNAKGDRDAKGEPTAFGLHQWHGPRLSAIKARTGIDILAAVLGGKGDVKNQIAGAWWELTSLPWAGMKAIQSQSTAYGAAMQATALFERAGALDAAERRGRMAERWVSWFSGTGPESAGPEPASWKA